MPRLLSSFASAAFLTLVLPNLANAHPGHEHGGIVAGFLHPVFGLDHVLAMLLVGVIAAQISGRALLLLPASFVTMMIVGGALGANGMPLDHFELGIAASLVVFGLLVATRVRTPVVAASLAAAGFATFHGYAHGVEMPGGAGSSAYAIGFVMATALLHAVGIVVWNRLSKYTGGSQVVGRVVGAGSALFGVALAAGLS